MRRIVPFFLLIVLFGSLYGAVRADTPVTPGDFMGMVVRDPHYEWKTNPAFPADVNHAFYDAMGANLQAAGVKWVRIEIFAEETQEAGSPDLRGQVNVEKYRYFINTVAPRFGLKVLALLATPLVRRPADDNKLTSYSVGQYVSPELIEAPLADPATDPVCSSSFGYTNPYMCIWLRNAFAVANAFPYDKTAGTGIAAYEVLNEENRYLGGYGKGMAPEAVATLLTKFYRVFKNNGGPSGSYGAWRNDVSIVLGGLHPDICTDCGSTGMTDLQYLNTIYAGTAFRGYHAANGKYPLDAVGYHPYPMEIHPELVQEPTGFPDLYKVPTRMAQVHQVMLGQQDAQNKIWVTEVGDRGAPHTVDPPGDNEARQAQFLQSVYWMLWQDRDFVQNVFWFKYEDFAVPPAPPSGPQPVGPENWGVVRLMARPTSQLQCASCEYDVNGTVDVYKQSYTVYTNMANYGTGLQTMRVFLPVVGKSAP